MSRIKPVPDIEDSNCCSKYTLAIAAEYVFLPPSSSVPIALFSPSNDRVSAPLSNNTISLICPGVKQLHRKAVSNMLITNISTEFMVPRVVAFTMPAKIAIISIALVFCISSQIWIGRNEFARRVEKS